MDLHAIADNVLQRLQEIFQNTGRILRVICRSRAVLDPGHRQFSMPEAFHCIVIDIDPGYFNAISHISIQCVIMDLRCYNPDECQWQYSGRLRLEGDTSELQSREKL